MREENVALDLLGDPVREPIKGTVPSGYASPMPGPAGETCGTCKHAARGDRYSKCAHPMMRPKWTHGIATDIRLRTRACAKWEAP